MRRAIPLKGSSYAPIAHASVSASRRLHSCTMSGASPSNRARCAKSTSFSVVASISSLHHVKRLPAAIHATAPPSIHELAAVQVYDLPSDERAAVAGQVHARGCNVVDAPDFLHRNLAKTHFQPVLRVLRPIAIGVYRSGRDGIGGDSIGRELDCNRLRKRVNPRLADDVVRAAGNVP